MGSTRFPTTVWTQIRRAKASDPDALERLLRRYRPPVLRFVRSRGFSEHDAEDIVQEAFLRIVKDDLLLKAEAERGRFRSLLLGITRNVTGDWLKSRRRLKRGGGVKTASLNAAAPDATPLGDFVAQDTRDEEFDREWVANLMRLAMDRLREESEQRGNRNFEALLEYVNEEQSYEELARRLRAKVSDVRNWLHQARKKLKLLLAELIYEYASSPEEYDAECAYLKRFL